MRSISRLLAKLGTTVLALIAVGALVSGCAPTGSQSTRVIPKRQVLYHSLQTYPNIPVTANVLYRTVGGQKLRLDVCLPAVASGTKVAPRPAIVSVHGGSWAHGDKSNIDWRSVCQWLASEGYVAASVGYRLAPAHPYPAGINDVRAAVRWLRAPAQVKKYSIDPTLIGAFGGSAGGNLVSLLGTFGNGNLDTGDRVAAVAELSGPENLTANGAELADFIPYVASYLGCRSLRSCADARAASPLFHVSSNDPPFFVGHSLNERIPLSQAKSFVARMRERGNDVTFVTVQGQLHSIAMLDSAMRQRIADFFHAKLVH
jgi:acetyl esterase